MPAAPLRQIRIADLIADRLRVKILNGELEDGSSLPPMETLIEEFQVSRPSLREALGILETQGLLSVNRGRTGGAQVHAPTGSRAAYQLALVLDLKGTAVSVVGQALRVLEPVCASMCAAREDRADAVVPILRQRHELAAAMIDDCDNFVAACRLFHEGLVELCGNSAIEELVGMMQLLWSSHEDRWVDSTHDHPGRFPPVETRKTGVQAHRRIVDLVAAGDVEGTRKATTIHLDSCQFWATLGSEERLVEATRMHRRLPT